MRGRSGGNLNLGPSVVELLLPQRRPFLMVDFVTNFTDGERPVLEAGRHISNSEPVFEGHFPGMPIWPGAFTMEGMGQTASLLMLLTMMRRQAAEDGGEPDDVLEALRNLDRGYRMHPGFRPEGTAFLTAALERYRNLMVVGASVDLKFLKTVFPGCRLDYRVEWSDRVGDAVRLTVEASVGAEPVARGVMTGAQVEKPVIWPE